MERDLHQTYGLRGAAGNGGGPNALSVPSYCNPVIINSPFGDWYNIAKVNNPSDFILLADSITANNSAFPDYRGKQSLRLTICGVVTPSCADRMHMRHAESKTDAAFADGHVESCDIDRIKESLLVELPSNAIMYVVEKDGIATTQINP